MTVGHWQPSRGTAAAGLLAAALVSGCGVAPPRLAPRATPAPSPTASPSPAPARQLALSVQPTWTVTDLTSLEVSGAATPGASISASGGAAPLAASVDAAGRFSLHLDDLPYGDTELVITETLAGYPPAVTAVDVVRDESQAAYQASAVSIPYVDLFNGTDLTGIAAYQGVVVTYVASVYQYDHATGPGNMVVSLDGEGVYDWDDDDVADYDLAWLSLSPTVAVGVRPGAVVRFWGTLTGTLYPFDTYSGSWAPGIDVQYMQLLRPAG